VEIPAGNERENVGGDSEEYGHQVESQRAREEERKNPYFFLSGLLTL
jgi:hypothetical protein